MVRVRKVSEPLSDSEIAALERLNAQLVGMQTEIKRPPYEGAQLFVAEDDGIVGMVTLCLYDAPSGRKAWIEDFVVDSEIRGSGAGILLMDSAVEYARQSGADKVMLTSRPSRGTAHRFYERYGFVRRDTDVFTLPL